MELSHFIRPVTHQCTGAPHDTIFDRYPVKTAENNNFHHKKRLHDYTP